MSEEDKSIQYISKNCKIGDSNIMHKVFKFVLEIIFKKSSLVGPRLVGSGLYVTLSWVDTGPRRGTNMSRANATIATILCPPKSLRGHKANLVSPLELGHHFISLKGGNFFVYIIEDFTWSFCAVIVIFTSRKKEVFE